ncbi:MAG: CDP-glucose 4,6-dehydratase [Methanomicrobiales archaeon]
MDFSEVYRGRNILITGDTGFKGSWLALWLHKLGAKVTGIGLDPKTSRDNYNVCGLGSVITHHTCDIRHYDKIHEIFTATNPEMVFHLAAQPLVSESYLSPRETFEINTQGTANILESTRHTPSIQVGVMVTSDKCYENQEWVHGYRETDPLGGHDPYSASKGAAEIVISSYARSFFSKDCAPVISSVRAGNVIGGGDWSENRIIPDLMRSLEEKKPIKLRNPGAIRPWQHVLDPLYGYLLLGAKMIVNGHSFSGAWNFGPLYQNSLTVEDLIRKFIEQGKRGEMKIPGDRENFHETGHLSLDISKSVHQLGWHPVLDVDTMIQLTLDEYRVDGLSTEAVFNQRCDHIDEYINLQRV